LFYLCYILTICGNKCTPLVNVSYCINYIVLYTYVFVRIPVVTMYILRLLNIMVEIFKTHSLINMSMVVSSVLLGKNIYEFFSINWIVGNASCKLDVVRKWHHVVPSKMTYELGGGSCRSLPWTRSTSTDQFADVISIVIYSRSTCKPRQAHL
jgi:hypothetical protein